MIKNIMNYDKNEYLRNILKIKKCKNTDFNDLSGKDKNKIIDSLVDKVKKDKGEKYFIGLTLIFEATIKNIIKLFYSMFGRYGYSFDEFISIVITEFYILTKDEFIQKRKVGFRANYNFFISIKLKCNINKIYNKEKNKTKIDQKVSILCKDEVYSEDVHTDFTNKSVIELRTKMYKYYINILCKDTKKLDIYFDKFKLDTTNKKIADLYSLSKAQVSKIIKEVNIDIKELIRSKNWNLFI